MIGGFPRAEVTARLDKAGVPFSPIARPEDLYDDPRLNEGLGLLETTLPSGVVAKLPRIPLEMGEYDFALRRNPPQIGEDTADVPGSGPVVGDRLGVPARLFRDVLRVQVEPRHDVVEAGADGELVDPRPLHVTGDAVQLGVSLPLPGKA